MSWENIVFMRGMAYLEEIGKQKWNHWVCFVMIRAGRAAGSSRATRTCPALSFGWDRDRDPRSQKKVSERLCLFYILKIHIKDYFAKGLIIILFLWLNPYNHNFVLARKKRKAEFESYLRRMMNRYQKDLLIDTHKVKTHRLHPAVLDALSKSRVWFEVTTLGFLSLQTSNWSLRSTSCAW